MLSHPLVLYFVHWRLAFFYLVVYFWSHWLVAIGLVGRIHTNYQRAAGASPAIALLRHVMRLGLWVVPAAAFYVCVRRVLGVQRQTTTRKCCRRSGPNGPAWSDS